MLTFDQDYFMKVSAKVLPENMTGPNVLDRDLGTYRTPDAKDFAESGIKGIHLGDYIFWDDERQTEFIKREYGWKDTNIEGTYKRYKSAECIMPGVHDFANYLKRGYGRASFHASADVRAGIITRDEAFENYVPLDSVVPNGLDYYSEITGISKEEFMQILEQKRHKALGNQTIPVQENQTKSNRPTLFLEDLRRWVFNSEQ
jgi:hypothetical protein